MAQSTPATRLPETELFVTVRMPNHRPRTPTLVQWYIAGLMPIAQESGGRNCGVVLLGTRAYAFA